MFYRISSPDGQHSRNVLRQPEIAVVIFDPSAEPAATEAVYLKATAGQVPDDELTAECEVAFHPTGRGARAFTPEEPSGQAPLRLYRATAMGYEAHIRGSHPTYGKGIDRRTPLVVT